MSSSLKGVSRAPRAVPGLADADLTPDLRRRNTPWRPAMWQLIIAVGCCAVAVFIAVDSALVGDLTYSAVGLGATLAVLVAVRTRRPAEPSGWYLLAAGNACFVIGDVVYNVYDLVLRTEAPFPCVADAIYLVGYPFLFAGVYRLSRLRGAAGSRESRADAAMVSVGALALSWQFLMGSYAHDRTLSELGRLVTMAYPVMDLAVLFIVVSAMMTGAARRPANTLVGIALCLMLIADFTYDVLVLHGVYDVPDPVATAYLFCYVLLAAAAFHPSASSTPAPITQAASRRLWLPLVAAAGFVSPVIILISSLAGVAVDGAVLASTSIVLFALAVVRATWLFRRLSSQTQELKVRGESLHAALKTQQELEEDLRHQAFHDDLTGLANRALLHDRVEHALQSSVRLSGAVALCFCDLDGFKDVNDSRGHQVGDQLLVIAAERLVSIVRGGDTVARLGGDEFAILLENVDDLGTATALAERVVSVLREPAVIGGQQVALSVSVGVALAEKGTTSETLLSEADSAMYEAKAAGKDRYAVFESVMRSRIVDRMTVMNSFQGSLQRGEYFLEYQPQLRLADGTLEGFEALVRWQHPVMGLVGPYNFIPLAEESGFIVPLGRWVLEQACLEAATWTSPIHRALSVSVNLSGRQLQDPNLLQDVRTALSFSGLPPERLVLEVTESVLMHKPEDITTVLEAIKALGIRIAIDDFGTGYSSLSQLRQFPIDIVKIDKSFIDPLEDPSTEATAFVHTILRLATALHLDATAEGVEYEVQREALARMNCHSAQGYLMSRPLGREAARDYIAAAADVPPVQGLAHQSQ